MKFENRFSFYTTIVVTAIHGAAICWFAFSTEPLRYDLPKEKFVVKTVALAPPQKEPAKEIAAAEKAPPQKKPLPPPQKTAPPPPKKTAPPSKEEPPPKAPSAQKKKVEKKEMTEREKILQKAKENIAKLRMTRDNFKGSAASGPEELKDVGTIESLSIDSQSYAKAVDAGYYGVLASHLRGLLRLPELGDVKILLTLGKQGNVVGVDVVAAESDYNRKHVEATIKKLRFPPFGKSFDGEKEHTFSITLTNEL